MSAERKESIVAIQYEHLGWEVLAHIAMADPDWLNRMDAAERLIRLGQELRPALCGLSGKGERYVQTYVAAWVKQRIAGIPPSDIILDDVLAQFKVEGTDE